jgi:hypothetical protein
MLKVLNLVRCRVYNSCRIWSPTEPYTLPPPPYILYTYTVYLFTQGRGRGRVEPERRGEGQQGKVQITKLG